MAALAPDKVAFIDPRHQVSHAELQRQVDRCALGLLELGVRPGDVVSFQLPNWIEWIVVPNAATRIGAISNPLIPIYRERELGFSGPGSVNGARGAQRVPGFDYPGMIETLRPDWPDQQHVLVVDGKPGQGTSSWEVFKATLWEARRNPDHWGSSNRSSFARCSPGAGGGRQQGARRTP
ncbi:MAG TPA: AMP-binding protein [Dermatophilaceae bacterium]